MSCEGNRHRFFTALAQRPEVRQALGLDETRTAAFFERLYQINQALGAARARNPNTPQEQALETGLTRKLFQRMQAQGLKPPTHSKTGLPKMASRYGYGQVERVLQAIEGGKPLPKSARELARHMRKQGAATRPDRRRMSHTLEATTSGALSAVGFDEQGYYRCANCGRFASQKYAHVCPFTATADDLARLLHRRLGLPRSAFAGYKTDPLDDLLAQARAQGEVVMVHGLTGRTERVTLDGIPQALMSGFVPEGWAEHAVPVIANGRVVHVLNADGQEKAAVDETFDALHALAHEYGFAVPPTAPILAAHQVLNGASPLHAVQPKEGPLALDGGQEYDLGHFIGTEYRKRDARGAFVDVGGRRYAVYARSQNPDGMSSARGRFAVQVDNVVIGRTLPAAIGILAQGRVARTAEGLVEVYGADGALLSVYDPSTRTAGDTLGSTNASPEQMAAVLAARMLDPQSAFDYALIHDFAAFRQGRGSPVAAADSGYLALRNELERGSTLRLGAAIHSGLRRCPRCGRFIGRSGGHVCPKQRKIEEETAAAPAPAEPAPVSLPVDPEIPPATATAAPVQVQISLPDDFADALRGVVEDILNARPEEPAKAAPPDEFTQTLSRLAELLEKQQQVLERMAVAPPTALDEERLGAAIARNLPGGSGSDVDLERLSSTIAAAVASAIPQPVVVRGEGGAQIVTAPSRSPRRRCPKCGQYMSDDHQCPPRKPRQGLQRPPDLPPTEVEQALSGIEMPAPDLYLDSVPEEWGGKRAVPLPENVPELMPDYEMGDQEKMIFNLIAMQLRKRSDKPTNRAFGLYGPAGTGKNTIARQLAASLKCDDGKQGLPYYEINITPDLDINQAIGEVVLTTDEDGNTVSRVRLGPIGQVAASGGVIAVNEIVRSPKLATALQSIIEDGEVSIPTPEGGTYKVPVHPSAIFITTWNPGYEGDADRPAQAFLSRITALPLNYPSRKEQIRRIRSHFSRQGLEPPAEEVMDAAVNFWNELRVLTGGAGQTPQIGALSPTRTTPGPRELNRFVEIGTRLGWDVALKTLEVICDQDAEYKPEQVQIIRDRFEAYFGGLV